MFHPLHHALHIKVINQLVINSQETLKDVGIQIKEQAIIVLTKNVLTIPVQLQMINVIILKRGVSLKEWDVLKVLLHAQAIKAHKAFVPFSGEIKLLNVGIPLMPFLTLLAKTRNALITLLVLPTPNAMLSYLP